MIRPFLTSIVVAGSVCCSPESSTCKMLWSYGMDSSLWTPLSTSLFGYASRCSFAFATNVRPRSIEGLQNIDSLAVIPADYSSQLTYLLRYPSNASAAGGSAEDPPIHHATLLLRQALTLQMSPTPTIGVSIIHENRNLLGIPTEVPPPISPPVRRRPRMGEGRQSFTSDPSARPDANNGGKGQQHTRQPSTPMGLPETFARGILERGESLGINKTVMNAVSELKVGVNPSFVASTCSHRVTAESS